MLNQVHLIGRLGQDPEVRYLPSGDPIATLNVATSRRWKDKRNGERKEELEWHRVTFFGSQAKVCADYLHKGALVSIQGRIKTQKYDKDGETRYSTGIVGEQMLMLESKRDGQNGGSNGQRTEQNHAQSDDGGYDFDDDIPFSSLNWQIKNHLL